jgi:hypothetical protein
MSKRYFFLSLTRIADFTQEDIEIKKQLHKKWKSGDYVACSIVKPPGSMKVEMTCGRMAEIAEGDILIGALGERFATLEATGSWREVGRNMKMDLLTSAGIFGQMTSISTFIPNLVRLKYMGHVHRDGKFLNMQDFALVPEDLDIGFPKFETPVALIVGTSMSAGKTTAARIIIRQLKMAGLKVVAAKLTGAGRYRDTLGMLDAGAEYITDFVEAGLPSTILPGKKYITALKAMLGKIQEQNADIVVIEIGASPLEPYNGKYAIKFINPYVKFRLLCASDPYSVYGVMKAFGSRPDLVSGIATNTLGGRQLIKKLCEVRSLNIIYPECHQALQQLLNEKLSPVFGRTLFDVPEKVNDCI